MIPSLLTPESQKPKAPKKNGKWVGFLGREEEWTEPLAASLKVEVTGDQSGFVSILS